MDISGTILTLPNQLSLYFEYQKGNYLPMASIVEEHNQNHSQAQKESLQWHWTLEYCGFQQDQSLICYSNMIMTKLKGSSSCSVPLCDHAKWLV